MTLSKLTQGTQASPLPSRQQMVAQHRNAWS